jgi:hypothetical protein
MDRFPEVDELRSWDSRLIRERNQFILCEKIWNPEMLMGTSRFFLAEKWQNGKEIAFSFRERYCICAIE